MGNDAGGTVGGTASASGDGADGTAGGTAAATAPGMLLLSGVPASVLRLACAGVISSQPEAPSPPRVGAATRTQPGLGQGRWRGWSQGARVGTCTARMGLSQPH